MNKLLTAVAVAVGALSLSACKQEGTSISNNQTQGMTDEAMVENSATGAGNMGMAANSSADMTYIQNAAASDMFEIETSRLALEKAAMPSVKTYAQMMIDEHTKSSNELKAAAGQANMPVPAALPSDKQAKVDALRGLSGAEFDRQYLADQRSGHQETLAKVNAYLAAAPAGPLKDHASKVTGVVQKHLNSLEKIK
jgi:putative membrane protein